MNLQKLFLAMLGSVLFLGSCTKPDIVPVDPEAEDLDLSIRNFVYRGMNYYYLYKDNVSQLADDHFSSDEDRNTYLSQFNSPEDLFYNGLVDKSNDRFSYFVDDYVALDKDFSGITMTTGINHGLSYINGNSDAIIGYARYVIPNSPAADKGVKRGDIFTKIDGVTLTDKNYQSLMASPSYTIHLAELSNGNYAETGETISLTKEELTENPIHVSKIIEIDGKKVGYLHYNSFTDTFDDELNATFATFKAENVTDLVLDLRYNGGGFVESAVDLASMITGQFQGEVFLKKQYNAGIQKSIEDTRPEDLVDRFNAKIRTGETINSLNLDKVYIIATNSSASASELVINGLRAHIDVVHIGSRTVGKFQASVTLHDSPNFGRQTASKEHLNAIQPLIYKSSNAVGTTDYVTGLDPDIPVREYPSEYKSLGDPNEPLLAAALAAITNKKISFPDEKPALELISESGKEIPTYQRMYVRELPQM